MTQSEREAEVEIEAKIERQFVRIVVRKCKEQGLLKGEFAEMVWPAATTSASRSKWVNIRYKATHTGKPQALSFQDMFRMARALNENIFTLLGAAMIEIEEEEKRFKKKT